MLVDDEDEYTFGTRRLVLFEVVEIDDDGVAVVVVVVVDDDDDNVLFIPPLYKADEDVDCTTGVTLRRILLALLQWLTTPRPRLLL